MEPASSWILVRFVSAEPQLERQIFFFQSHPSNFISKVMMLLYSNHGKVVDMTEERSSLRKGELGSDLSCAGTSRVVLVGHQPLRTSASACMR